MIAFIKNPTQADIIYTKALMIIERENHNSFQLSSNKLVWQPTSDIEDLMDAVNDGDLDTVEELIVKYIHLILH